MKPVPVIDAAEAGLLDLSLRDTFRTHWKTIRRLATLRLRLRSEGTWGEGEAYTIAPDQGLLALRGLSFEGRDPRACLDAVEEIPDRAARSAADMALHDLLARREGVPLWSYLGLEPAERTSCVSVGVDRPEAMLARAREWIAKGYPILKVKLTTDTDLSLIDEIRSIGGPSLRIWVDANQAFEPEQAVAAASRLRNAGVTILEQPLPVGRIDAYAAIRPRIGIPIYLDEEIRSAADAAAAIAAGGIDGINVKLAKLGGIRESLRAIHLARASGLSILLGCYFESSLGISAPTHLQGLADRVDLDAPLFLEDDPYEGLVFRGATIMPPSGPGLGVRARDPR